MCRASALAYSRLKICSLHSCGILHQVRQRHHGVPGRIGDHLHGQRLVLQRVGLAGLEQLGELELLGRRRRGSAAAAIR